MSSEKDLKLLSVKRSSPDLYQKVVAGEISLQDAFNETQRTQLGLTEFRGKNSKKKEFSTDFKRIIQLHKPTEEELVAEIKKAFPFTFKDFLK
jgi:hypothetical protein